MRAAATRLFFCRVSSRSRSMAGSWTSSRCAAPSSFAMSSNAFSMSWPSAARRWFSNNMHTFSVMRFAATPQ